MPEMAVMEHGPMLKGATLTSPTLVSPMSGCAHPVCSEGPALPSEHKASVTQAPVHLDAVSFDVVQHASEPMRAGLSSRGPPRFRRNTPVDLHTTLLI